MTGVKRKRSAAWVYENAAPGDLTEDNVVEIVQNLYSLELAEAWFVGMGWPEGYAYCRGESYLRSHWQSLKQAGRNGRAVWFACRFLKGRKRP